MIKCICAYFNFTNNQLRKNHYIEFRKNFKYPITTIEVALDKSLFFIEDSIRILANDNNILWQKERLFNIALQHIPENFTKIVWVDTDIIFLNDNWLIDLEKILDEYTIAQPFEYVFETEGNNHCLNNYSYSKCLKDHLDQGSDIPIFAAMGLCWGFNRNILANGFYDRHILGSNDALQLLSVMGDYLNSQVINTYPKALVKDWLYYCRQMPPLIKYNVGYCKGKIQHLYHGNMYKRGYHTREKLLSQYQYDPKKHIELDTNHLYRITEPNLQQSIIRYFDERHKYNIT